MRWAISDVPAPYLHQMQSTIISVSIRISIRIRIRRRVGVAGEPTVFGRHTLGQLKAIYKK